MQKYFDGRIKRLPHYLGETSTLKIGQRVNNQIFCGTSDPLSGHTLSTNQDDYLLVWGLTTHAGWNYVINSTHPGELHLKRMREIFPQIKGFTFTFAEQMGRE